MHKCRYVRLKCLVAGRFPQTGGSLRQSPQNPRRLSITQADGLEQLVAHLEARIVQLEIQGILAGSGFVLVSAKPPPTRAPATLKLNANTANGQISE